MPESDPGWPTRRTFLGGVGLAAGAAIAGCTDRSPGSSEDDARARIEALEAELAEVKRENDALSERVAELERERDRYRRQLETANLWGFERDTLDRLQSLADAWADSVVAIDAITDDGSWSVGTGWMYDDGVVVSNAHVVAPRRLPDGHAITRYEVWDRTGRRVEGELLGYTYGRDQVFEQREDIGFLDVPESVTDGRLTDHGATRELAADEPLLQIGHPYSLEYWTAAAGPFVAHDDPFFSSNVPGQPGVSGSPVIDLDGDVIGMTWGGQYVRRPRRGAGEPPAPGDGQVLTSFDTAMNGMHSYMHRIHAAAEALV